MTRRLMNARSHWRIWSRSPDHPRIYGRYTWRDGVVPFLLLPPPRPASVQPHAAAAASFSSHLQRRHRQFQERSANVKYQPLRRAHGLRFQQEERLRQRLFERREEEGRETTAMGNASSMLTQYDIEEVQEHCNYLFSQQEIVSLYERFCQLDRSAKGFISEDEFLSIPEFSLNPLSKRLLRMVDGLNFKDFVAFLSTFSAKAMIFKVYDIDGKGE
ncbi:hypothetical protein EJB05_19359 [Eragrostis curvula]|uniref:EF-hand domain-containing protein n=1 Tax=Eragrostis curvula TaxID=38414 RepID=A0A5J9UX66_9POAL|nr:hypothetical protein EJB05_19359 [Eragrostis curvula]